VGDCGPVHSDGVVMTEIQELLPGELSVVVGDDGVWDPKAENNVLDKIYRVLGADLSRGPFASIRLVNLSTATSRWVKPPSAFLKGPKKSRLHTTNDLVMGMVWSSWARAWIWLVKYWHIL
jgi:hypothetical protein